MSRRFVWLAERVCGIEISELADAPVLPVSKYVIQLPSEARAPASKHIKPCRSKSRGVQTHKALSWPASWPYPPLRAKAGLSVASCCEAGARTVGRKLEGSKRETGRNGSATSTFVVE